MPKDTEEWERKMCRAACSTIIYFIVFSSGAFVAGFFLKDFLP